MHPIRRFIARYHGRLIHLWVEEVVGWLLRSLPGFVPGMLRYGFYQMMFKRMGGLALVYPGVYLTHTYGISVGSGFSINTGALMDGRGGIAIGDNVMVGPYVVIVSSNHDYRQTRVPMNQLPHLSAPVSIGSNVWVGAHAVISAGVTIGNGVVVAAGAVVTRDVEDGTIVGGVPAAEIARRQ
ncbi:MAG: acyltransferase [Pseudomonadota bacterium]